MSSKFTLDIDNLKKPTVDIETRLCLMHLTPFIFVLAEFTFVFFSHENTHKN